jgi:hypothetical protein
VLVAQPEAVPLFAAYLGEAPTYAAPTGVVEDPMVMDWRGAEERLREARPADLAAIFAGLPEEARVLLVTPANEEAATDTTWIELFRAAGRRAERALRADDGFRLIARVSGPRHPYVSFDATVWERVETAS